MPMVPQQPIIKFFSPSRRDQGLIELHDSTTAAYQPLDPGTPHKNTRDYPGFKLGRQFNLPNDHKWIVRIWVKDEVDPTWFAWAEKFSGEANAYPIFVREYRELRETYAPKTKGQPLKSVYKLLLSTAGSGYVPGSLPLLTFNNTGTSGTGAAGHAIVAPDGTIADLILDDAGDDYATAPAFTIAAPPSGGTTATGAAVIQPATALLVAEETQQFPDDSEFRGLYLQVVRVYETLPGPYIPFTRYDENLGPIQGRRRAVLNSGQATTLGATSKKTYEGRDASSIVSWEIEENWSDGSGSPGNPAYPILKTNFYDNDRGAVAQTSQIVADTTSPGSLTVSGGTATQIRYEAYQDNPNLRKKIIETWAVPGPIHTSTEFEKDGIKKVVTRQMRKVGDLETSEELVDEVTFVRHFIERLNEVLAFQIVETITVDDASLLDLPSFTTSIPNVIPEIFRAEIPTHVESHIIEGTAEETALSLGEFEHTERQLTPLYKEVRSTVLDDIGALPITISGNKETNERKQVVTVAMKLCVDSTTPTAPTSLIDVDFKKLGNGLAIEITKTIPSVFDPAVYAKQNRDAVPERFKGGTPDVVTRHVVSGTASAPSLSAGDTDKSEQQRDVFTKETSVSNRAGGYPSLAGQTYDESLDIIIPYTEDLQTAGGGLGAPRTDITPLGLDIHGENLELARTVNTDALADALDAYMLTFPGTANVNFPDELVSIESVWEKSSGNGDYTETAFGEATNSGYNVSPRGSGQASAAIIPSLIIKTKQKWGQHLPTTHYFFFLPSPVSTGDVLAKIGAVDDWPDFNPESHTIVCRGQRLSLRCDAAVQRSEFDNGSGSSSDTHSEGAGSSREVSVTVNTIHIPPTIHPSLAIDPSTDTEDLACSAHADSDGYDADSEESGTVTGTISPDLLAATAGDTTIPTGTFLLDTHCEPAGRLNYVRVHAETIDL